MLDKVFFRCYYMRALERRVQKLELERQMNIDN